MSRSNALSERKSSVQSIKSKRAIEQTKNLRMMIKSTIISYEDNKFAKILKLDGVKPEEIQESLSLEKNRESIFQSGQGAGKSGSFFFFTSDKRFLIKTLANGEKEKFLSMIDDYIDHI